MAAIGNALDKITKIIEGAIPVTNQLPDSATNLVERVKKVFASFEATTAMDNIARDIEKYRVQGKEAFEKLVEKIQFDKKHFFDPRLLRVF